MLLVQLRREVSDVRLVHQHHRPRRRQPPHPLRHLQPHLLRRMDLRRLHRARTSVTHTLGRAEQ